MPLKLSDDIATLNALNQDDVPAFSAAWRQWAGSFRRLWEHNLSDTQARWVPWVNEAVARSAPKCLDFMLQSLRANTSPLAQEVVFKALIRHDRAELVPGVSAFFSEAKHRTTAPLQEALRQGAEGVAVALLQAGWPAHEKSAQSPFLLAVRMGATAALNALRTRGEPQQLTEAMVTLPPKDFRTMWFHLSPELQERLAPQRQAHNLHYPNRFTSEAILMASSLPEQWMRGWGEAAILRHQVKPLQWIARQVPAETLNSWLPRWQRAAICAAEEDGVPQNCVWWLDRAGVSWSPTDIQVLFDDALKHIDEQRRHRLQPRDLQSIENGLTLPPSLDELEQRDRAPEAKTHGILKGWRRSDSLLWKEGLHLGRLIRRFPDAFEARMIERPAHWWGVANQTLCVEALRPMAPFVMDWDMPLRMAQWHGGVYADISGFEVKERQTRHLQWWREVLSLCPEEERRLLDRPRRAILANFIVLHAGYAEVNHLLDEGYRTRGVDAWDADAGARQEADQWWCQLHANDEFLAPAAQALLRRLQADQPTDDAQRVAPMREWKSEYPQAAARWKAFELQQVLEAGHLGPTLTAHEEDQIIPQPLRRRPRL